MKRFLVALITALSMMVPSAWAQGDQSPGFNTSANCLQTMQRLTDIERVILGSWVTGYVDRLNNKENSLLRVDNALTVAGNVQRACERSPQATFLEILQTQRRGNADTPGTRPHAVAFLNQFLGASPSQRIALTAQIKPTEADIRAVYAQPLADRLVPMYEAMFTPDAQVGPNEGQTEILSWYATTAELREGSPELDEFPGGYADVRQFFVGEHPIVRFTFVEAGATRGMTFDGLIYVNDRWVLMPRPWRALPE